jgi:NAD(P)-dependent dehydrogenase (short-subunit alcohol dehydrogenase family)
LFGFTANLVTELSADNVLSNVVIPSWTLTEHAVNYFPEGFQQEAVKAFPTHRITQPEDVASLIAYLGSAMNTHVNGEYIKATGKCSLPMLSAILSEFMSKQKKIV